MRGGVIESPIVVADIALVSRLLHRDLPGLRVVDRPRDRRGRWGHVDPDVAAAAMESPGAAVVVAARAPRADPGAAALPVLAGAMGMEVVRLPCDARAAAWAVGWIARLWRAGAGRDAALRTVHVLAGAATMLCPTADGASSVARPRVVERWARMSWRRCGHCAGGGLAGAYCGRCGVPIVGPEGA